MTFKKTTVFILVILLLDQLSKIYIKTHFILNESIPVLSWFKIVFVENEGMAWGTTLSDLFWFISRENSKITLTLFRIVAVSGIGYWLYTVVKQKKSSILILAVALIFSGALGNIIDSVFYGVLFNDSTLEVASFLPQNGGYSSLFHGKVVDMLHFPLWSGILPESLPIIGGGYFSFFDPVFNIADMAITSGIAILLLFSKRIFK